MLATAPPTPIAAPWTQEANPPKKQKGMQKNLVQDQAAAPQPETQLPTVTPAEGDEERSKLATAPPVAVAEAVVDLPAAQSLSEGNDLAAASEPEPQEPQPGPPSDGETCPLFIAVSKTQDPNPRLSGKIQHCAAVCLTRHQQRHSTR